jgi:hypothetical protein
LCLALYRVSVFRSEYGEAAMPKYLVVNIKTRESTLVDLDEAARIAELDPDEIEWAIEQVGRCDTEEWAILPEGATYMPYDPDNPDHNPRGRS